MGIAILRLVTAIVTLTGSTSTILAVEKVVTEYNKKKFPTIDDLKESGVLIQDHIKIEKEKLNVLSEQMKEKADKRYLEVLENKNLNVLSEKLKKESNTHSLDLQEKAASFQSTSVIPIQEAVAESVVQSATFLSHLPTMEQTAQIVTGVFGVFVVIKVISFFSFGPGLGGIGSSIGSFIGGLLFKGYEGTTKIIAKSVEYTTQNQNVNISEPTANGIVSTVIHFQGYDVIQKIQNNRTLTSMFVENIQTNNRVDMSELLKYAETAMARLSADTISALTTQYIQESRTMAAPSLQELPPELGVILPSEITAPLRVIKMETNYSEAFMDIQYKVAAAEAIAKREREIELLLEANANSKSTQSASYCIEENKDTFSAEKATEITEEDATSIEEASSKVVSLIDRISSNFFGGGSA